MIIDRFAVSLRALIAFASLFVTLSGCSNVLSRVYLHDEALKELTDSVDASFPELDAEPTFFDQASVHWSED